MPYLPNFATDLFISYSSIDNQPLLPGQNGWISSFKDALRIRLAERLGTQPTISGDHESGGANGDGASAGVMVSIVSPAYVGSEDCLNQIKQFTQVAKRNGGDLIGDKSRIFKVIKLPVKPEKQPAEIVSLLGYEFYQVDPPSGRPHELNPEVNPDVRQSYLLKLDDLAYDIQELLQKLSESNGGPTEPETPVSETKSVFISYASEDETTAQTICALLERQGVACWLAARDLPEGAPWSSLVTDALDKASAVVLILSRHSNASVHVTNEVEWATGQEKPVFTVRVEDVLPSRRLALHVQPRQWLNAWVSPIDAKIIRLASAIADEINLPREGEAIYLAETTFDLKDERDSIRRELQERGYNVLPDKALPSEKDAFRTAVREYLARSRLSIHLVGANYGDMPKGATESLVYLQNELAGIRRSESPLSSLIWIPVGLQTEDNRQRQFIETLHNPVSDPQVELLQTSLEELKSLIEETLTSRRPPPPTASAPGGPLHIYLICDQQDRAAVLPLRDYLYDNGYEAVLPAMTGDEAQIREDHKENLLMCDACLIFYGAANDFWLRSKLRDLQKSAGYGRKKPMLATAVYIAAPETADKNNFKTLDALVIRNTSAFQPDSLQQFLAAFSRVLTMKGAR